MLDLLFPVDGLVKILEYLEINQHFYPIATCKAGSSGRFMFGCTTEQIICYADI